MFPVSRRRLTRLAAPALGSLTVSALPACFEAKPFDPGESGTAGTAGATTTSTSTGTDSAGSGAATTASSGTTSSSATTTTAGTSATAGTASVGTTAGGCGAPLVMCGELCVDTSQDPDHCGMCDTPCGSNEACTLGTCITGISDVAVGYEHTCILTGDGTVHCWGANDAGQLGLGHNDDIGDNELPSAALAVDLGGRGSARQLALGDQHTCALLDTGEILCWGNNTRQQLGIGGISGLTAPNPAQPVQGVDSAVAIAAGKDHTCAIVNSNPSTREVVCWGANDTGQLGIQSIIPTSLAQGPVDLGGLDATAVALGISHTCALMENGEVYCWGSNAMGQLGIGVNLVIGDDEPPKDGGPVPLPYPAVKIAAGEVFTCAVLEKLESHSVTCWGRNTGGKLGYGGGTMFGENLGDDESPSGFSVPLAVPDSTIKILASGQEHTCVVFNDDTMQCWGVNWDGQLGLGQPGHVGDDEPASAGHPVLAPVPLAVAGSDHTCMLTNMGGVRCWGNGQRGQRGYGNNEGYGTQPGEVPNNLPDVQVFP